MKTKLQKLEEQRDLLNKKILEEKKNSNKRMKILLGDALLKAIDEGAVNKEFKEKLLNKYVRNKADREFLRIKREIISERNVDISVSSNQQNY